MKLDPLTDVPENIEKIFMKKDESKRFRALARIVNKKLSPQCICVRVVTCGFFMMKNQSAKFKTVMSNSRKKEFRVVYVNISQNCENIFEMCIFFSFTISTILFNDHFAFENSQLLNYIFQFSMKS